MPGTTRSARKAPSKPVDEQPEQAPVADEQPNAEEQVAAAQGSADAPSAPSAPVDFMALLATAEEDTKASRKSDERTDIDVPEEWIAKVKDTYERRKRVHIPGITTKDMFAQVGDLIRAAADRIEKSATVRAKYTLPDGAEDKPENRVLSGLTFTVGPRRKGPQSKKAADAVPTDTADTPPVDADSAPSGD